MAEHSSLPVQVMKKDKFIRNEFEIIHQPVYIENMFTFIGWCHR